jgi:hypothetical protein
VADPREDILERLVEVAAGVTGVATALRNPGRIEDLILPAIAINDGDEAVEDDEYGRGRPNTTYVRVTMTPEITIKVSDRHEDVGTALNVLRAALIKAVVSDTELAALCGGVNGLIRYQGCSTGLVFGRGMIGEMSISFGLVYVLRPPNL